MEFAAKLPEKRWATYEEQVFELFKEYFPAADVARNVHLKGLFSKRKRQIDILITEQTPAGTLKTVVETKFFKRKVDVKAIDGLSGFVEDVGANRGMLITTGGYTKAALKRAFYGPSHLELDVLNFSELQRFQAFGAIPRAGKHAFLVPAPFGWVIDATQGNGYLACMYRRGLDAQTAKEKKEFLYINFWDKTKDPFTAAELDDYQIARMRLAGPVTVSHKDTVQRTDSVTRLRIADVKRYKCLEVTGFLEFNDVIFYAVLLTPHETQRSNIRRLETVLRQALPMKVSYDHTESIQKARAQLRETNTPSERALLLREIGRYHRAMDHFEEARLTLEESLSIDPENAYWIINELVPVLVKLNDRTRIKELMARLLRLDPHNPTVFNDCFSLGSGLLESDELLRLIEELKQEFRSDEFVQANCDYYSGNLLAGGNRALAREKFIAARQIFRRILPNDSEVFKMIRIMLKQCS
jgi:hypothetical protein